ncbi:MAG: DNA repair protein RecO [Oscillospiraceae bacterium]|jgi:DNA repair protein RecO (recombination protein O)|nr:DNA repair protein RecO [Oscillospiraceae bacterium]
MFKTTRALVIRETKYKEMDKVLTLLTDSDGKLTVSARAVMGKNSKLAAACQLLTFSELTLYERLGHLYVKEAAPIEQFLGLREDICLLALGTYFAELLEAVSDEDSPNPEILSLGLNSLFALSSGLYPPERVKAVFELRLMCLAGFEPMLDECARCSKEPERPILDLVGGCLLCSDCRTGEQMLPLSQSALEALRHIVSAPGKRIFSFELGEGDLRLLGVACENYVTAQLERRFLGLDYWKKVSKR